MRADVESGREKTERERKRERERQKEVLGQ